MSSRPRVVAVTAAFLILAAWLAWRSGPVPAPAPVPPPATTQTGEVIPSGLQPTGATDATAPVASPAAAASVAGTSAPGRPAVARNNTAAASATPPANSAAAREGALVEVGKVRRMIVDYHTLMGENPVGTNAEIMRALMGHNPHQAMLGPPDGQTLNDNGELVDPWGTPYFFHQLSRDRMEVHSAGPDRIMGTSDDVVVK